jgi:hydrogenase maturation protein HypF
MVTRSQILVRGIVQGVGFRPFVYAQATRRKLRGRVFNNTTGVLIEVEGDHRAIEQFVSEIKLNSPPLSAIDSVECNHNLEPAAYADFVIAESAHDATTVVPISADVATCGDCLSELFDPLDRRHYYPFINCTNCGPRFTIVEDVPYDRARTTMRDFEMCAACFAEYSDPSNRRFHAEPTACAACGPRLVLRAANSMASFAGFGEDNIISRARSLLLQGLVIAIKGLGGFHLACDALNQEAVELLRTRKYREDKPFAMMADSVDAIAQHCFVTDAERSALLSKERPIVLLAKKPHSAIAAAVAPSVNNFGFMLPYTPLHHLLLNKLDRPLVMTSGNVSDEPMSYDDREAVDRLSRIADYFLLHDRRIHMRTDDSVVRVCDDRHQILRRSRGFAPAPIKTNFKFERQVLACGAELKNTFCLGRDNDAFVSHHIGDLENLETLRAYQEGIDHFRRLFQLEPEVVAYDLHPEYLSTKYALAQDESVTKIGVQHHHAHIASCMADNQIEGDVIGVALDGLGFGTDGRLWGGEFFVANFVDAERIAHLRYLPMPGGAKVIREPWRMAAIYFQHTFGDEFTNLDLPFVKDLSSREWPTLRRMAATLTNSPETSSMGRLFDAISSLLGIKTEINYEGQAAVELEAVVDRSCTESYVFRVESEVIDARGVFRSAVEDLLNGLPASIISVRFHNAVAGLILSVAEGIREKQKLNRVALSGGVFQNRFLLEKTCGLLRAQGFHVLTHSRVPTNDGGISFGQAAVANAQIKSGRI